MSGQINAFVVERINFEFHFGCDISRPAMLGTVSYRSGASDWIKLWDCQFYGCMTGFWADDNDESVNLYVYNMLFSHLNYSVVASISNIFQIVQAENVTVDSMGYFTYDVKGANVSAVNSLFTTVTNMPWSSLMTDCSTSSSSSGIYQPTGAGGYYLTNGSTFTVRNARTTSIDPGLLEDLQTLTTYPPAILPTYITANTNLSQQVARNTGIPDLGYRYCSIDYAMNSSISNAAVIVAPGTVLSAYGEYGMQLLGTVLFTWRVIVRPKAEADLSEAVRGYETQRPTLGGQFLDEISRVLILLKDSPQRHPLYYRGFRRLPTQRFPYSVLSNRRRQCNHRASSTRQARPLPPPVIVRVACDYRDNSGAVCVFPSDASALDLN